MHSLIITTLSEKETLELGKRLGKALLQGVYKSRGKVTLCLYGELGSGKTILVKGIASSLGIPERDIGSASFVFAQEYRTEPPFCHIDLYRLESLESEDWIWDYIEKGFTVIEWAEKLKEAPPDAVKIHIKIKDKDEREISIEGIDQKDWDNFKKGKI